MALVIIILISTISAIVIASLYLELKELRVQKEWLQNDTKDLKAWATEETEMHADYRKAVKAFRTELEMKKIQAEYEKLREARASNKKHRGL